MESNSNKSSSIDHLVVAAAKLEEGVQYVEQLLGVKMQQCGKHARMGTHNYLLKLADKIYLEVIAIDPEALAPNHPRWFGLDKIAEYKTPRLITWIARTENIDAATKGSLIKHGTIQQMSRGNFEWSLTIPDDGSMPCDGIAPMLIEWKYNLHPCDNLEDKGCRLLKLEAYYLDEKAINTMLEAIGFDGQVVVNEIAAKKEAYLVAYIQTAKGICELK